MSVFHEVVKDVWIWSWPSPEKGYNFNGLLLKDGIHCVLVDPVSPGEAGLASLEPYAPFDAIYLTNKDHERLALEIRDKFETPVWIHEKDAGLLKGKPNHTFREGDRLLCGIEVLHLPDQKTPGECAFYIPHRGLLIVGDALIGVPAGKLSMLPETKYRNFYRARIGRERLRPLYFETLLVGDGIPVLREAHEVLEQFFLNSKSGQVPDQNALND